MGNPSKSGTVYLVGAGPGDPGLITVRGAQLLSRCDAVVYDYLIPDELVATLPPRVEKHYVGKRAGRHSLPQEKINELLVDLASSGKSVVRLKGGDPLIFGRGGEEAAFLREHGVPFEIVPGITAGTAGPAYVGIPGTDRHKASSITFLTGHRASDKATPAVDWEWVAHAAGTLVIYMGVSELPSIAAALIEHGMEPDTPAALIERGTCPTQRIVRCSLAALPEKAQSVGLEPPALVVIGHVVDLADTLKWFERKPLFGLRVMVTRPSDQAGWVYARLRELGAEVLPYPTIATEADYDKSGWEQIDKDRSERRWLLFTSENGVRYFMERWLESHDVRSLAGFKVAAVGFGTARALNVYRLTPDFVPTKATVAELARQMAEQCEVDGAYVVRVRGNLGDDTAERTLQEAGAGVLSLPVYRTFTHAWTPEMKEKLFEYPPDVIVFTSGSTADGFVENLTAEERERLTGKAAIVSIGPSTSAVIRSHGMKVALEAVHHNIPAVIDELVGFHREHPIK
jgi:uroporphyrinogen III methyltransferase/synthase